MFKHLRRQVTSQRRLSHRASPVVHSSAGSQSSQYMNLNCRSKVLLIVDQTFQSRVPNLSQPFKVRVYVKLFRLRNSFFQFFWQHLNWFFCYTRVQTHHSRFTEAERATVLATNQITLGSLKWAGHLSGAHLHTGEGLKCPVGRL